MAEIPSNIDLESVAVVALGANLPGAWASVEAALEAALEALSRHGLPVLSRSSWWRSAAWPDPLGGPAYLNGIALVEAGESPWRTLQRLAAVEAEFGRIRDAPNAARTLDLDLIAHGRTRCETPDLTLPHPRAADRLFVMGPLAEIAPDWRHPVLNRTARDLAPTATAGRDARPID